MVGGVHIAEERKRKGERGKKRKKRRGKKKKKKTVLL